MKEIHVNDLQRTLPLLDVREADEYAAGHVPGAISKPLSQIESWVANLDQDMAYAIICQAGMRSERAGLFLAEKGYDVTNVLGGTAAFDGDLEN